MEVQLSEIGKWMEDVKWALNAMRVRRFRRRLGFAERARFDRAIRPRPDYPNVIAYPDAIYHITVNDVVRAMRDALSGEDESIRNFDTIHDSIRDPVTGLWRDKRAGE